MKKVKILIGVAGSGKSTYIKSVKKDKDVVVSSDSIRLEIFGRLEQSDQQRVINEMENRVRDFIQDDKMTGTLFYDSTSLSRRKRRHLFSIIKSLDKDVKVIAVPIIKPLQTILEQNAKRTGDACVPKSVIKKMYTGLEVPRLTVDCDEIEVIADKEEIEKEYSELIKDMKHDSPYHEETVLEHIKMTIQNAEKTGKKILSEIARYHDLGKAITAEEFYSNTPAGRFFRSINDNHFKRFIGHEKVSAQYYLAFNKDVINTSVFHQNVLEAILKHMLAHDGISQKVLERDKINDELLQTMMEFAKIDSISSIKHKHFQEYKDLIMKK